MIQFYFLSVLLNAFSGCILFFGISSKDDPPLEETSGSSFFPSFTRSESFRFVLGLAAIAVGVLKLLSPVKGDVPIIGDVFPAAAGIVSGFALIYEHVRVRKFSEKVEQNKYIRKLLDYKTYIGIAAMIAAALHFLFPAVVVI